MQVNNAPKLYIIVLLLLCATALRGIDAIDQVTYVALVGPLGGYAVGNGIAARRGEPVEPVFTPRPSTSTDSTSWDRAALAQLLGRGDMTLAECVAAVEAHAAGHTLSERQALAISDVTLTLGARQ